MEGTLPCLFWDLALSLIARTRSTAFFLISRSVNGDKRSRSRLSNDDESFTDFHETYPYLDRLFKIVRSIRSLVRRYRGVDEKTSPTLEMIDASTKMNVRAVDARRERRRGLPSASRKPAAQDVARAVPSIRFNLLHRSADWSIE